MSSPIISVLMLVHLSSIPKAIYLVIYSIRSLASKDLIAAWELGSVAQKRGCKLHRVSYYYHTFTSYGCHSRPDRTCFDLILLCRYGYFPLPDFANSWFQCPLVLRQSLSFRQYSVDHETLSMWNGHVDFHPIEFLWSLRP